jgi:hypothetical protein
MDSTFHVDLRGLPEVLVDLARDLDLGLVVDRLHREHVFVILDLDMNLTGAIAEDVPLRTDLPEDHALQNYRMVVLRTLQNAGHRFRRGTGTDVLGGCTRPREADAEEHDWNPCDR